MKQNILFILVLLVALISCNKTTKETNNNNSNNSVQTTTTGSTAGGSTSSGSTSSFSNGSSSSTSTSSTSTSGGNTGGSNSGRPVYGNVCNGDTSDGVGDGDNIRILQMGMAGQQNWFPGAYSTSEPSQYFMVTPEEASYLFATDARLKVRFKVNQANQPATGTDDYCYARTSGAADSYRYTMLKFTVALRDVYRHKTNNTYRLGDSYAQRVVSQPVSVSRCSEVFDFSSSRNVSAPDSSEEIAATVVEVSNVRSDSTCQTNGTYCESDALVRKQSCWDLTMQVSVDSTQDIQ